MKFYDTNGNAHNNIISSILRPSPKIENVIVNKPIISPIKNPMTRIKITDTKLYMLDKDDNSLGESTLDPILHPGTFKNINIKLLDPQLENPEFVKNLLFNNLCGNKILSHTLVTNKLNFKNIPINIFNYIINKIHIIKKYISLLFK